MALFPELPSWAGSRKVKPVWILLKQETVSGSGISWAIFKSAPCSRQITTPAPHYSVFYRPDALPVDQPTVSSTEGRLKFSSSSDKLSRVISLVMVDDHWASSTKWLLSLQSELFVTGTVTATDMPWSLLVHTVITCCEATRSTLPLYVAQLCLLFMFSSFVPSV